MVDWADACILVTGSGSGIGKAATLRFLEWGSRVTVRFLCVVFAAGPLPERYVVQTALA